MKKSREKLSLKKVFSPKNESLQFSKSWLVLGTIRIVKTLLPSAGTGTSGFLGVSWHTATRKWLARLQHGGKRHSLGSFAEEREAAAMVHAAREAVVEGPYLFPNSIVALQYDQQYQLPLVQEQKQREHYHPMTNTLILMPKMKM